MGSSLSRVHGAVPSGGVLHRGAVFPTVCAPLFIFCSRTQGGSLGFRVGLAFFFSFLFSPPQILIKSEISADLPTTTSSAGSCRLRVCPWQPLSAQGLSLRLEPSLGFRYFPFYSAEYYNKQANSSLFPKHTHIHVHTYMQSKA